MNQYAARHSNAVSDVPTSDLLPNLKYCLIISSRKSEISKIENASKGFVATWYFTLQ